MQRVKRYPERWLLVLFMVICVGIPAVLFHDALAQDEETTMQKNKRRVMHRWGVDLLAQVPTSVAAQSPPYTNNQKIGVYEIILGNANNPAALLDWDTTPTADQRKARKIIFDSAARVLIVAKDSKTAEASSFDAEIEDLQNAAP